MSDLAKRLEAWDEFARWERKHPAEEPDLRSLIIWLGRALAIARHAGDLPEESPEELARRVLERKAILAHLPPST